MLKNNISNLMKKTFPKKHQFRQVDFICLKLSHFVMELKIQLLINMINRQFKILLQRKHKKIKTLLNLKMMKKLRFIQLMIMFQMLLQIICSKIQLIWVEEKVAHRLVVLQTLFKILKIIVVQVTLQIFLEIVEILFKVFMQPKTGMIK